MKTRINKTNDGEYSKQEKTDFSENNEKDEECLHEEVTEHLQKMQDDITLMCNYLVTDTRVFDKVTTYKIISKYVEKYDRILYSKISIFIFAKQREDDDHSYFNSYSNRGFVDTMLWNCESLIEYSKELEENDSNESKITRILYKIYDHIHLAQMQYVNLRDSDEIYKKKFEKHIEPAKLAVIKEINTQLLTVVSIFTALAFLLFGGIDSLSNVFSGNKFTLLELGIVVPIWGFYMINIIYIFMYCIGRMTKLDFINSYKESENNSFFRRYFPIIITNIILLISLSISLYIYGARALGFAGKIKGFFKENAGLYLVPPIFGAIIVVIVIIFWIFRSKKEQ